MTGKVLTFTNLFPSALRPHHGRFVQDRMQRVAAASGLEWEVVCPVPRVPLPLRRGSDRLLARLPRREVVDGVTVHHVPYRHLPGVSARRQAARIARACAPLVAELSRGQRTVLDAHYVYPDGVAAMRLAARFGLPGVVTARGTDVNVIAWEPGIRTQVVAAMQDAAALLAVSEALRARFDEVLEAPGRVRLARNGVDLEAFQPGDRARARRQLGLPADGPLVLGVGRLVDTKGFHHAAEALQRLGGAARLVLIGEGPDRGRIEGLLPADRLLFLGGRSRVDVARAYQACDLLVLPTEREGWPNVVTEALASGLPVVASAVGGIPEICGGSAEAALVPPGDVDALCAAIRQFLDAPPDAEKVRSLASRYSWDETVGALSTLFHSLLA